MFKSVSEGSTNEMDLRRNGRETLCHFGIEFLDDALIGIGRSDLILVGAPSGVGKTQLCCSIALTNIIAGKRVHFLALEAEEFEIERRLKFQIFCELYYGDPERPKLNSSLSYDRWVLGDFIDQLEPYEIKAQTMMQTIYKDFFVFYKGSEFTVTDLIENVVLNADRSDLFIIDHAHYFDLDDDNENRAMKQLAKTCRTLVLEEQTPIILVAHLRKRDKVNEDLVAGMDEFHGSSDLAKIATKIVTISPGGQTADGRFQTFFRIPKNRSNGGVSRFVAEVMFDPKGNNYEKKYRIGSSELKRKDKFEPLAPNLQPEWAKFHF